MSKHSKSTSNSPPGNISPQQAWQEAINAYQSGDPRRAQPLLQRLIKHPAADGNTFLLSGLVEIQLQHWQSAQSALEKALEMMPDNPDALMALALVLQNTGAAEQALPYYEKAIRLDPKNPNLLHNAGVCYQDMGRNLDAVEYFQEALEIDPNREISQRARAPVLARLRRFDDACLAYQQLMERFTEDQALRLEYAEFLEQSNKINDCVAVLPNSLDLEDGVLFARAQALRARILIREQRYAEALELLDESLKQTQQGFLHFLRGSVLDRLGHYEQALQAFKIANQTVAGDRGFNRIPATEVLNYIDRKIEQGFSWLPANSTDTMQSNFEQPTPVFLVGLPRSGTTLLNRILDAHPDIQVIEEIEALRRAETELTDSGSVHAARTRYFEIVKQHVNPGGGWKGNPGAKDGPSHSTPQYTLVDKSPYHAMSLDTIAQLFPGARVVYVLRHPYDAALSCFMQDFKPGPVNASFLTLESSAHLCARFLKLMHAFEQARPQSVYRMFYEKLVDDFRGEVSKVLDFIDVGWDDAVNDYANRAADAGPIMTSSYAQVTRKIYGDAVFRWKHYQPWLAGAMTPLSSELDYFGYQTNDPEDTCP